jgi:hypothetical protein
MAQKQNESPEGEYSTRLFYLEDQPRTLFPLTTNRILVENGEVQIAEYIAKIGQGEANFLPQKTVHANKDRYHLRRTVKLDPVAEYFIYDLVYRNRQLFRKPFNHKKMHYGYRFEDGRPIAPSESYNQFKLEVWGAGFFSDNRHLTFDISAYFNNLYHHDLNAWFSALSPKNPSDSELFGRFLREINSGRSLDCLPQDLYPTKMIGNDFLRFIENFSLLQSDQVLRFMDDICLLDEDESKLISDFDVIQKLLGQKGLSINSAKTRSGMAHEFDESESDIEELKANLLKRRRETIISSYDSDEEPEEDQESSPDLPPLTEEEIAFAISLLNDGKTKEEDAELVMIVMRGHVNRITDHLHIFAKDFPHLAKNFYLLCNDADDKNLIANVIIDVLQSGDFVSEYQLFWFGVMLEKYLMDTTRARDLIPLLYHHRSCTDISRAKILEIRDNRFGLSELREGFLREGRSDWLAWSSAVGSLALKKDARNYLLGYFKNGSTMNTLIAGILEKI